MGFRAKFIYFSDESALHLDEDSLLAYFRTYNALRDPEMLVQSGFNLFAEILRLSTLIHCLRLDETEQAALLMLRLIRYAVMKFDIPHAANELMKDILKGLHEHYASTCADGSVRMGSLVMVLTELEKGTRFWAEHNVLMRLNGREPVADFFDTASNNRGKEGNGTRKYYLGTVCLEN